MSMTTDASLDTEVTMSNEQRLNLYVRTILCGVECIPNRELDNIARNFKCGVSSSQDGKMTTWVPKLCLPVLLVGTDTKENLVITCKTGAAYKLSDVFQIPPLPKNVVLVGNCTLDYDDTFKVLIYDGDNLPRPEVDKKSVEPSSLERYSLLRDFYPRYFGDLASSTFVLQWVGYLLRVGMCVRRWKVKCGARSWWLDFHDRICNATNPSSGYQDPKHFDQKI
jgi:hypothetical protein